VQRRGVGAGGEQEQQQMRVDGDDTSILARLERSSAPWLNGDVTRWETQPQPVGESRWAFPPAARWPEQDVIALGGDLAPETLIGAYRRGIFPMPLDMPDPVLAWWSPDPRGILPLDGLRVTRSMRQSAKRYEIRVDTCFTEVMRQCANPARPSGWITSAFIEAYTQLHELGWAHSVEAFDADGRLAGGLYGVRINGLFAGESMFTAGRDASKVALIALVSLMRRSGMILLDVQWQSDHLRSLGAIEVSRQDYLSRLADALHAASPASQSV
jgi:leucyl/phenylalanyl-tRNA--protein transferase